MKIKYLLDIELQLQIKARLKLENINYSAKKTMLITKNGPGFLFPLRKEGQIGVSVVEPRSQNPNLKLHVHHNELV